jgi:hypothetical protein
MSAEVVKLVRYTLPLYALVAVILTHQVTGFGRLTWVLIILTAVLVFTWGYWSDYLLKKFEEPAKRKESLRYAALGVVGVLFLRPFAVDRYWKDLEKFVLDVIHAYNGKHAAFETVVALGKDDKGPIAKVTSTPEEWRSELRRLAKNASAIVILPVHSDPTPTSGIVLEIVEVLVQHQEQAIFVMPPREVWDRAFLETLPAGSLERLWLEGIENLGQVAPSLHLRLYQPEGCFWTLRWAYDRYQETPYPYTPEGAEAALHDVLDRQRLKRDMREMKEDPEGPAARRRRDQREEMGLPPFDF